MAELFDPERCVEPCLELFRTTGTTGSCGLSELLARRKRMAQESAAHHEAAMMPAVALWKNCSKSPD